MDAPSTTDAGSGGSSSGGATGTGGGAAGGVAGSVGAPDAGGDATDAGQITDSGGEGVGGSCGGQSQACCAGDTCAGGLACLNSTTCSCARTLFGRYLLRTDGALLFESDPPATAQTPVLDASTGFPLANVTAALEGPTHGCALQGSSQTVWCWRTALAGNSLGQLGSGVVDPTGPVFRATQVMVTASQALTDVVALSTGTSLAGGTNTCAVTADGKIHCWGNLAYLTNGGNPLTSPFAVPITANGVTAFTGALQVGLDGFYACAIVQGTASREVWCWGANPNGSLGTGDALFRRYPTKVVGVVNPLKVAPFGFHGTTCVLDGTNVRCWGFNQQGQVGAGTINSPILAPTLATLVGGTTALDNIVDIHGGGTDDITGVNSIDFACALASDHTVQCWGRNRPTSPTTIGIPNVVSIGNLDDNAVRVLTSDGLYHLAAATRAPNCGLLQ